MWYHFPIHTLHNNWKENTPALDFERMRRVGLLVPNDGDDDDDGDGMDERTRALIAKYSPSPSKDRLNRLGKRSPSPRAMRFAPSSPRVKAVGRRSPSPIKGRAGRSTAWSPEASAAEWAHSMVDSQAAPTAEPPRTVMDFPPRAARRWDEDETVPRAEFDAYVRSTERVLSQLQAAVDSHSVGPNLLDRLVATERRLHALERGWHETLKRLNGVEETAGRPPDLKLVEARCSWLEDELREQSAQVSGLASAEQAAAASEDSLREFKQSLLLEVRQELADMQRQVAAGSVPQSRFERWENCIKEELGDATTMVESLRATVTEQSVARDAQLTAIEQAVRRLQRASVPNVQHRPQPDGAEAALVKAQEQASANAKALKDAEDTARKLEKEKKAAEEEASKMQELLRAERIEREQLSSDLALLQQHSPPAVQETELSPTALDSEKRLERIWKDELAATELRLNTDVEMLRSRNRELEQQLADATAAAAAAAAATAVVDEPETASTPFAFPKTPTHPPKLRKASCVVHVGGLDREELEDESQLAVRLARSHCPSDFAPMSSSLLQA
jgi:hypothetical protein